MLVDNAILMNPFGCEENNIWTLIRRLHSTTNEQIIHFLVNVAARTKFDLTHRTSCVADEWIDRQCTNNSISHIFRRYWACKKVHTMGLQIVINIKLYLDTRDVQNKAF